MFPVESGEGWRNEGDGEWIDGDPEDSVDDLKGCTGVIPDLRIGRAPGRSVVLRPVALILSLRKRARDGSAPSSFDHVPLPSCLDDAKDSPELDPAPAVAVRLMGSATWPVFGL